MAYDETDGYNSAYDFLRLCTSRSPRQSGTGCVQDGIQELQRTPSAA